MQQPPLNVNDLVPLVNVGLMLAATKRTMNRPRHLPGLLCYYGPAGWGKTCAASYVANELDAHHLQLLAFWNRKTFWEQLCLELGVRPEKNTIASMGEKVCATLGRTQKPLIIDEADLALQRGFVDDLRAIFEGTKTTVIIIGEESLPDDLLRYERIHSRVLEWVPAQPPDLQDARTLAAKYARSGIAIADDMIEHLHEQSGASIRRICVNIERVQEYALENGLQQIDVATWGNTPLYTGAAPVRSTQPARPPRRR